VFQENLKPLSTESPFNRDNLSYEFDGFRVDLKNRALLREGESVSVSAKAFEMLLVLVENNGRVLEKNELMNQLWPETFVEEINLNVHISALRKALGESAANHQYIETIPKRGYRFTANIKALRDDREATSFDTQENLLSGNPTHSDEPLKANLQIIKSGKANDSREQITSIRTVAPETEKSRLESAGGNRRWIAVLMLTISALAIAGSLLYLNRRDIFSAPTKPFQKISKQKLTSSGRNIKPTLSPDGEYVAYVLDEGGRQSLWLMQVTTKSSAQIVAPAEVSFNDVTFAPDGKLIYYDISDNKSQSGALYQIPMLGGTPRKVMADVNSHIALSPDGKELAFVRNDVSQGETSLVVAQLSGKEQRIVMTRKRPEMVAYWSGVAWSPDGKLITCAVRQLKATSFYMQVVTVRVEDGQETLLGPGDWENVEQIAWFKDNTGVVVSGMRLGSPFFGDQLWQLSYPEGNATQVTDDLISYEGASIANRSTLLITSRSERISKIWLASAGNPDDAKPINSAMSDNYSEAFGLNWTPDNQLVYGSYKSGNADIWMMDADGAKERQLTYEPTTEMMFIVTPDGRSLVFASKGSGPPHLWKMDINGENLKQLTDGQGEQDPSISPDGQWIVYNRFHAGNVSLSKIAINGGEPVRLTQVWSIRPQVSPDGKLIAYMKMDEAKKRLVVALMSFAGGEPLKVFDAMPVPEYLKLRWSPDGRALHYINTLDGVSNIWSQPLDGSSPKPVTHFKSDHIYRFAWSPDGKTLALDRGITLNDIVLISDENH
jgi:eukaryotic-like serine/threonine-protein kinase